MQSDVEGSGMLNVIPKTRLSPNERAHRTTHSPYDVSVVQNQAPEHGAAVESHVPPQVRVIMRPPQSNGAQDVSVGSSDPKGRSSPIEKQQPHHHQPSMRVGYARSGVGSEGVSSVIAGDDADVHYERVRDSIFNSSSTDTVQGGGAATGNAKAKKPHAMPYFGAAAPSRSAGQERGQGPHDLSADHGYSRSNDGKQLADASAASSMASPVSLPLHQQHPKMENDAMDYQRYPKALNLQHHHQHRHRHHYQPYPYGQGVQRTMYVGDYGEREGYDVPSQNQRYAPFAPHQAYQQYPPQFLQPPPPTQHADHQHFSMQYPMYPPPHCDAQDWRAGGGSNNTIYSDPNNNSPPPTMGGDPRYRQGTTALMHPHCNRSDGYKRNSSSPPFASQQQQQHPPKQWSRTQALYPAPHTGPNMNPGMRPQQVPSPYPSSGDGSYTRYSSTPTASCPGVAPSLGGSYSGMGTNWELQPQSQFYPDDMQQPQNFPPVYQGNAAPPGSYNAGMHRQDYVDSANCGQQSNTEVPLSPPPPLSSHHRHHQHHHQHHQQQQYWGYGGAQQQIPYPHQQQQQQYMQPYLQETGYNMPHAQHGFSRFSHAPSGAPEENIAMGQHCTQQFAPVCPPQSELCDPRGQCSPLTPFQQPPHQSYQQPHQQGSSGGRFSGAAIVGSASHRQQQHHHGKQSSSRWGESNGWSRGGGIGHNRADHRQQPRRPNANESGIIMSGTPPAEVSANAPTGNQQKRNDVNVSAGNANILGGGSETSQLEKSKK